MFGIDIESKISFLLLLVVKKVGVSDSIKKCYEDEVLKRIDFYRRGIRSATNAWPDTKTFGEFLEEYYQWLWVRPVLGLRTTAESKEKAMKELYELEKLVRIYCSDTYNCLFFIPILLYGLYRTIFSLIYLIYDCLRNLTDINMKLFFENVMERYRYWFYRPNFDL